MRHGLKALALVALLGGPTVANANLITIDFEEFDAASIVDGDYEDHLISKGFVLDSNFHYDIAGPVTGGGRAYNGTNYFIFDYWRGSNLTVYGEYGGLFGVKQLDLAETLDSYCSPDSSHWQIGACDVHFMGYLTDGGTISQTLRYDGGGSLNGFQTFTFDGQWIRLTAFSIHVSDKYLNPGLDNLVLRTVPEPSTLALFGLGLLGLGLSKWGRLN